MPLWGLALHDLEGQLVISSLIDEGLLMIGKLLGHAQVQTTARYAHLADDPVESAAEKIAETISGSAGGKPRESVSASATDKLAAGQAVQGDLEQNPLNWQARRHSVLRQEHYRRFSPGK